MHEWSLCQILLRQVLHAAGRRNAVRVREVHLLVGPLSGAEPALLEAAFPFVASGTIADGARLSLCLSEVGVICDDCGQGGAVSRSCLRCPLCGSAHTRLKTGHELLLTGLDIDVQAGCRPHV